MNYLSRIAALSICFLFVFTGIGFCGEKIKGEAIKNLVSGKTVAGTRGKKKSPFVRTFNPDGTWVATNPTNKNVVTGKWKINSDKLCIKKEGQRGNCSSVLKDGDQYIQRLKKAKRKKRVTSATWKILTPDNEVYITHHKKISH